MESTSKEDKSPDIQEPPNTSEVTTPLREKFTSEGETDEHVTDPEETAELEIRDDVVASSEPPAEHVELATVDEVATQSENPAEEKASVVYAS